VPLVAGERVVGVLNVVSAAPRILGQEEVRLLDSVGRQVGLAVENARLWEEVKGREARLAQLVTQLISTQEAERKRIARELHDEAGQRLAAVSLGLQTIEQTDGLPDAVKHLVADSMELLKRLLDEVHQLAVDLRPHALDQLGLRGAIESCVREFGQRTALRTDLEVSGFDDARPSSDIEIAIYRVVQEALANVRKHANASRVGVLLKRLNGSVVVVVEDDGIGFDAAGALRLAEDGQLGLFGMRERAALLNGQLTIESGRGQGTTVIVEIPISDVRDSDSPG
jgi:signal transduction histidine kinase